LATQKLLGIFERVFDGPAVFLAADHFGGGHGCIGGKKKSTLSLLSGSRRFTSSTGFSKAQGFAAPRRLDRVAHYGAERICVGRYRLSQPFGVTESDRAVPVVAKSQTWYQHTKLKNRSSS